MKRLQENSKDLETMALGAFVKKPESVFVIFKNVQNLKSATIKSP